MKLTHAFHVRNVHNLTLKGQGQWPVTGAEETVMQSLSLSTAPEAEEGFTLLPLITSLLKVLQSLTAEDFCRRL